MFYEVHKVTGGTSCYKKNLGARQQETIKTAFTPIMHITRLQIVKL
jgi:hypothetical protein